MIERRRILETTLTPEGYVRAGEWIDVSSPYVLELEALGVLGPIEREEATRPLTHLTGKPSKAKLKVVKGGKDDA